MSITELFDRLGFVFIQINPCLYKHKKIYKTDTKKRKESKKTSKSVVLYEKPINQVFG